QENISHVSRDAFYNPARFVICFFGEIIRNDFDWPDLADIPGMIKFVATDSHEFIHVLSLRQTFCWAKCDHCSSLMLYSMIMRIGQELINEMIFFYRKFTECLHKLFSKSLDICFELS